MTSATHAVGSATGARLRRTRAASAASIACEQVIVHTEHTLGASPEVCFCDQAVSLPSFDCPLIASLKSSPCLSKTAQTWRAKPANSSDLVHFSGKSFRHGEKIRLHKSAHETNLGFKSHVTKGPPEKCKESVFWIQILCRNQANPQILWCYQAKVTESLQKSGKSTDSLVLSGKSYRIFAEVRRA